MKYLITDAYKDAKHFERYEEFGDDTESSLSKLEERINDLSDRELFISNAVATYAKANHLIPYIKKEPKTSDYKGIYFTKKTLFSKKLDDKSIYVKKYFFGIDAYNREFVINEPNVCEEFRVLPIDISSENTKANGRKKRIKLMHESLDLAMYNFFKQSNKEFAVTINDVVCNANVLELYNNPDYKLVEGWEIHLDSVRYGRSSFARKLCLQEFGYRCSVCDFDFESKYGEIGREFIHVHHENNLSLQAEVHIVNPIEDLKPVCPNCHAMLHKTTPAMTIDSLKLKVSST